MNLLRLILGILESLAPQYTDEYELQALLEVALLDLPGDVWVEREVTLRTEGAGRIDLVVADPWHSETVGIEVKIDGSGSDVLRQLQRYAATGEVDALILVTTRSRHHHIPTELHGIPIRLVTYVTAGL